MIVSDSATIDEIRETAASSDVEIISTRLEQAEPVLGDRLRLGQGDLALTRPTARRGGLVDEVRPVAARVCGRRSD
jgi:hypothetical protein